MCVYINRADVQSEAMELGDGKHTVDMCDVYNGLYLSVN